jgi:hypothetical protein
MTLARLRPTIGISKRSPSFSDEILEGSPLPTVIAVAISPVPSIVTSTIIAVTTVVSVATIVPIAAVIPVTAIVVACRHDHATAEERAQD